MCATNVVMQLRPVMMAVIILKIENKFKIRFAYMYVINSQCLCGMPVAVAAAFVPQHMPLTHSGRAFIAFEIRIRFVRMPCNNAH